MRKVVVLFTAAVMVLAGLVPGVSATPSDARLTLPALTPAADDALAAALDNGELSTAEYALHRARALFRLGEVRNEFGDVEPSDPHAATFILRDLSLRLGSLDGDERTEAEAILARPDKGGSDDGYLEYDRNDITVSSENFLIHYVNSGRHSATSDYANDISAIMENVYSVEVDSLGWLAPKSDASAAENGGDAKFDVYLGDIGRDELGLYGYCTTDPGQTGQSQHTYCVLDNDFSAGQFGDVVNGLNAAKVTAAHEYNHAIQFTYDTTDDMWMLEATATWMEDQVYDDVPSSTVNDNYQYLRASSLATPSTPADTFSSNGFQYGQFIWMRFLSESLGSNDVIRNLFERAALPGLYSLRAIEGMLGAQTPTRSFADSFAEFAAWNASARTFYEEGLNYETAVSPVRNARHVLAGTTVGGGSFSNVDHLTSRYVSFKPGPGVIPGDEMTVSVDLGTSGVNRAMVVILNGATKDIRPVALNNGVGNITVPLGGNTEVVLVVSNAAHQMNNCKPGGADLFNPGTCGGTPAHDNKTFKYAGVMGTTPATPGGPGGGEGPTVSNFKAAPNPFTPNGDGRKDKTKVRFDLEDPALLTLKLYRGTNLLATPVQGFDAEPRDGYFYEWNGKAGGRKMRSGTYKFKLVAVGDGGTTTKTTKVELRR